MDAAEAAELVWNCGGAPRNDATSRMEHRLSLTLLNLQREIELLTKAQPDGEDLGGILPVAWRRHLHRCCHRRTIAPSSSQTVDLCWVQWDSAAYAHSLRRRTSVLCSARP